MGSVIATLGVAVALALVPGAASASQSATLGCQSTTLQYFYLLPDNSYGKWTRQCSGNYSLNSQGTWLLPGGWSGYIYFSDGTRDHFCDFGDKWLNYKRVIQLTMAATKISECR